MTRADTWKKRPVVTRYFAWKDELVIKAEQANYSPTAELFLEFIMPLPKYILKSKKKTKEMIGRPHQQKPDCDNLIKAFQDALLEEDSHIYFVCARKIWGVKGGILVAPNIEFFIENKLTEL